MSETANRIALAAAHSILGGASETTVRIGERTVTTTPDDPAPQPWPGDVEGLTEADGPWPPTVDIRCEWEGGGTTLRAFAKIAAPARGDRTVTLAVRDLVSQKGVTFVNLSKVATAHLDEETAPVFAYFALRKRKGEDPERERRRKAFLKGLVRESGMPLLSRTSVEVGQIDMSTGAMLPSPQAAFERLVRTTLYKLDFIATGPKAAKRGVPLIDLAAAGLQPDDDDDDEEESEDARRYWAGGFGERDRLERFLAEHRWELGWKREEETRGAQMSWRNFDQIHEGDWFAIKGYGGQARLDVHFVGEVTGIDPEAGALDLAELKDVPHYSGPAPRGSGAGSWFDTLVPVTRDDVIELIFGEGTDEESALTWDGPRNLILYGPPGTGKTYLLRQDYFPKLTRETSERQLDLEALLELSWFEVIGAAIANQGGEATAMELRDHPFVKTKYQAKDHKAPIGARIWGTLQTHTVESSETVSYSNRSGRLVFDKREDGTWFFVGGVPPDIAELAESLAPAAAEVSQDFVFLTFHQSYAYEDFIEGIRPKTQEAEGGASLSYELEDGVFLRAATAAIRLAGFDGTLDAFCRLDPAERSRVLEGAPPYGVFIDEINRGNVSRIFGELITLLEEDKRLGAAGELIVTLPYSRRRFGVPSNLCVIGTMNTADRSVEALDSALRRRFAFLECAPDATVLEGTMVEGVVDVEAMLRTINHRIELLLDRDHLIGHAHLMAVKEEPTIDKLKEVFAQSIIPLLSEYFYADLGRVGLVLGRPFVRKVVSPTALAPFDHDSADQLADRPTYRLTSVESLSTADFRSIYETPEG